MVATWQSVEGKRTKKPSKSSNLVEFLGYPIFRQTMTACDSIDQKHPARRFVDEQLAVDLGARRPVDLVAMISHDIPKSVEDGHGYGGFIRFPVHGGTPKSSIFIGFLWIFHETPSSYWGLP